MCIRDRIYTLWVVQDTLAGTKWLVHQDTPHSVRPRKGQLVRLGIAQADCQTSLWVPVDQKHFLSGLCQTYSQVRTSCCLDVYKRQFLTFAWLRILICPFA